jgi:hypothetical protein
MNWLWNLDLIRFFEFYLVLLFICSLGFRIRQYRNVLALLRAMPGRWPRLLQLIREHYFIFLTWGNFGPAFIALGLFSIHTLACRLVWPHARITLGGLVDWWPFLVPVVVFGIAMTAVDLYTVVNVGKVDRREVEKYFDQAEYWLRSWTAPMVRVVTFGYVNPRQIVAGEVRKALHELNRLLTSTLWWVSLQTGLRIAYGLSLWLTFAWSGPHA